MRIKVALLSSTIGYYSAIIIIPTTANAQEDQGLPTNEELATYGLTLDQVNSIVSTESPNDFGGLASSGETNQLWADATAFEYGLASRALSNNNSSTSTSTIHDSLLYYPYFVCNTSPNKTGAERREDIETLFQNTPGVNNTTDFYESETKYANTEDILCGVIRAVGDTIAKVYEAHPEATEWMHVQPGLPSMKMVGGMVDALQTAMDGGDPAGVVSISEEESNDGLITRNIMGVQSILCPGVQETFEMERVPGEDILNVIDVIREFLIGNGGNHVKESSFYYHRVNGGDANELHTDRMLFWSNAISAVMNDYQKEDGTNACLDDIIATNMEFTIQNEALNIFSRISHEESKELGSELGMSGNDVETCIWYMVMGLATNPLICSVEQEHKVKTFCADGSSDTSNCQPLTGGVPEPPSSSTVSSPSSRIFAVGVSFALIAFSWFS